MNNFLHRADTCHSNTECVAVMVQVSCHVPYLLCWEAVIFSAAIPNYANFIFVLLLFQLGIQPLNKPQSTLKGCVLTGKTLKKPSNKEKSQTLNWRASICKKGHLDISMITNNGLLIKFLNGTFVNLFKCKINIKILTLNIFPHEKMHQIPYKLKPC